MKVNQGEDPLSEEQLNAFERGLGLEFPSSLRRHFLRANGGYPDLCVYDGNDVGTAIQHFLPLAHSRGSANWVYEDQVLKKSLVPRHFFPFATDPGGNILYVDCSSSIGNVFLFLHDIGPGYEPLVSMKVGLEEFCSRLKPDE